MLTEEEYPEIIADLTGNNTSIKSDLLRVLCQHPSADRRILPYLSRLLYDKSPCLLSIPYLFGEIRWLAAHALAAERAALGIQKPVSLRQVVKPLDTGDIVRAEYAAGIKPRGGVDGLLINFGILNDMGGYLPHYDLNLSYWIEEQRDEVPKQERLMISPALFPHWRTPLDDVKVGDWDKH